MKKIFKKHRVKPKPLYNIGLLRNNIEFANKFSNKLDEIIQIGDSAISVDDIHNNIVDSILHSTESVLPIKSKSTDIKPWLNDEFLDLINKRNKLHFNSVEWKHINTKIKKTKRQIEKQVFFR